MNYMGTYMLIKSLSQNNMYYVISHIIRGPSMETKRRSSVINPVSHSLCLRCGDHATLNYGVYCGIQGRSCGKYIYLCPWYNDYNYVWYFSVARHMVIRWFVILNYVSLFRYKLRWADNLLSAQCRLRHIAFALRQQINIDQHLVHNNL